MCSSIEVTDIVDLFRKSRMDLPYKIRAQIWNSAAQCFTPEEVAEFNE